MTKDSEDSKKPEKSVWQKTAEQYGQKAPEPKQTEHPNKDVIQELTNLVVEHEKKRLAGEEEVSDSEINQHLEDTFGKLSESDRQELSMVSSVVEDTDLEPMEGIATALGVEWTENTRLLMRGAVTAGATRMLMAIKHGFFKMLDEKKKPSAPPMTWKTWKKDGDKDGK